MPAVRLANPKNGRGAQDIANEACYRSRRLKAERKKAEKAGKEVKGQAEKRRVKKPIKRRKRRRRTESPAHVQPPSAG